jgi:hypothetical protein
VNHLDDDNDKVALFPLPEWAKWLLLAALAAGALAFLLKALRRGSGGAVLAAAAPIVALGAARSPVPIPEPIDVTELQAHLREIAAHEPLLPPIQLFQALQTQGVPLLSDRHMASELRKLGLRSEVRTVKGRTERRWYNLTEYATNE